MRQMSATERRIFYLIAAAASALSLLYISAAGPYWKITPDSSTYVSAAVSLARGEGYLQGGRPVYPVPPATSLVYSIPLVFFPGGYFLLNLSVKVLAILSAIIVFRIFRQELGDVDSALISLLSLGSVLLFHESTYLLSDVVYLFFSMLALALFREAQKPGGSRASSVGMAFFALAATMARPMGLAVVLAVVVHQMLAGGKKTGGQDRFILPSMGFVLFVNLLWEIRNHLVGISYLQLYLQRTGWVVESGYVSSADLISRLMSNTSIISEVGFILTNGMFGGMRIPQSLIMVVAFLVFLCGLVRKVCGKRDILGIYAVIYLTVIAFSEPPIASRYMLPMMPLLIYYAREGLYLIISRANPMRGRMASMLARGVFFSYSLLFLIYGVHYMVGAVGEEHISPFGDYPIKLESDYDLELLAIWMRDNTPSDASYAYAQPALLEPIAERRGYAFPFSADQERLFDLLKGKNIGYILVGKNSKEARMYLQPIIAANPGRFVLLREAGEARLYYFKG
jgi:hypothetical protein